ncbi:MAG: hypothetical protein Q8W46_12200 [Candidatus Palauibacterales bacterium]|nr:hypothetical protein [Candidatus Palauibacterales bacterium]
MRFSNGLSGVVVASLLLSVPAVRAQEHEHGDAADHAGAPSSDFLTIETHPEREEWVLSLGPIDLPAHTSHHALQQLPVQEGRVPFDMTVDAYRVEAVDRDGNPVPQDVIHHFNLLDPTDRELFLPIMRRVFAASHETPPVSVPEVLLGVPFEADDRFLVVAMLHNPTDRDYDGVHVRMVMNYNRSHVTPLYRMYPFHLDVMFPIGSKAFDLPPGRTSKSWEGSPAIAGGIVGMGGHLHDHAERLELIDVTEGRVLWRYEPDSGPDGHVDKVPVLRPLGRGIGFPIYPSHRYRVEVTYFNPTGETIVDGGMGSVAGALIPFEYGRWPAADPDDPIYAADYANVISGAHGTQMAGETAHSR